MYSTAPSPAPLAMPETDPVGYIRGRWAAFEALFPKLLAEQHRAARLSATLPTSDPRRAEARAAVDALARLIRIHAATVERVESWGAYVGLGAVTIPPAALAALTALALIVAWVFRAYEAQKQILDMIESGTLTPAEAAAIKDATGPAPGLDILEGAAGIGRVAVFLVLAFAALALARNWQWRRNPDLLTFHDNPPPDGVWSHRVYDLRYRHDDDGENYVHDFRPGVRLQGLPDGSVRLFHPRRRLWRDF